LLVFQANRGAGIGRIPFINQISVTNRRLIAQSERRWAVRVAIHLAVQVALCSVLANKVKRNSNIIGHSVGLIVVPRSYSTSEIGDTILISKVRSLSDDIAGLVGLGIIADGN